MIKWAIPLALAGFLFVLNQVYSCNEAVCGSVVSKCLLTQSCKCDRKENCSCCKDCHACLSYLYSECCSCVDMCPKPNETASAISRKSYCEDFSTAIPSLFESLTEAPDSESRWSTIIFPIDIDASKFESKKDIKIYMKSSEQETVPVKSNIFTVNCTVAYWAQCMSLAKCSHSCISMGASSYRWFHDGCCECIGARCLNYGINESRCSACPIKEEQVLEEDEMDFGEDQEEDD